MVHSRLAFLAAVLICVLGMHGCTQQPVETAAQDSDTDWEQVYLERLDRLRKSTLRGGGLRRYDPLEPVNGSQNIQSLPVADAPLFSSAALAQADAYAAERNSSSLIIWRNGAIEFEAYYGDFNADTPIVSKSLAKPLTAILVGRAIAQGHLTSLDQRAADFITEWANVPGKSQITLYQLLSMRSGLLGQGASPDPQSIFNRSYLHPRHAQVIIDEYPLMDPPGSVYEYSNSNAELIAPILERATGQRYSSYITAALLEPLGAAGGDVWVNRPGGTAHSGCCILLPPRTWLKMAILLMQDGAWDGTQLLPEGYVETMRTPTNENAHHGMGVWAAGPYVERRGSANPRVTIGRTLHSEPYADRDLTLFDGNSNQVVYMIPSQNMIVLRTGGDTPKDKPWDNSFLPNLLIADVAAQTQTPLPTPQAR